MITYIFLRSNGFTKKPFSFRKGLFELKTSKSCLFYFTIVQNNFQRVFYTAYLIYIKCLKLEGNIWIADSSLKRNKIIFFD